MYRNLQCWSVVMFLLLACSVPVALADDNEFDEGGYEDEAQAVPPPAISDLMQQCLSALAGDNDHHGEAVACQYLDVPKDLPAEPGPLELPVEKRVLQDGVVCVGNRMQAGKLVPLLIQMEKISSLYSDANGQSGWSEQIFPQYIYKFKKVKNNRRKIKLHEVAPWLSATPERDTWFRMDKKKGTGLIRIRYWYGGRFLAIPYAKKDHALHCGIISQGGP